MSKSQNPFQKISGCTFHHDIPIVGYGITIMTIQSFLFDHGFNPEYYVSDIEIEDIDTVCQENQDLINHVTFSNIDDEVLMHYAQSYKYNDNDTLPTKQELNDAIKKAVYSIFDIPETKATDKALSEFIAEYADDVLLCDYS